MRSGTSLGRATVWATVGGTVALLLGTATAAHAEGDGDVRVVKTVVNGGSNVVLGTSRTVRYPIAITVRDDSGVRRLTDVYNFNRTNGYSFGYWSGSTCEKKSSTTSVCTATITVDPRGLPGSLPNANVAAGGWRVDATVQANDGDYWISDQIAQFKMKRASRLVTDVTPEPVRKGATLTVKGKLTRADWERLEYHGFAGQTVKLQFRPAGAAHYSTVRTARTDAHGRLSTRVTATSAGSWRWHFPGTDTTARITSAGDAVALR